MADSIADRLKQSRKTLRRTQTTEGSRGRDVVTPDTDTPATNVENSEGRFDAADRINRAWLDYRELKQASPETPDDELIERVLKNRPAGEELDDDDVRVLKDNIQGAHLGHVNRTVKEDDRAEGRTGGGSEGAGGLSQEKIDERDKLTAYLKHVYGDWKEAIDHPRGRYWEDKDTPGSALVIRHNRNADKFEVWRIRPGKSYNFGNNENRQSKTRNPDVAAGWVDDDPKEDKFGLEIRSGEVEVVPITIPDDFTFTPRRGEGGRQDLDAPYTGDRLKEVRDSNLIQIEGLEQNYQAKNNKKEAIEELIAKNKEEIGEATTPRQFEQIVEDQREISRLIGAIEDKSEEEEKKKDTVPEGTPTDVFSRKFMKKGDEFTHVLWDDDEWAPIKDGDRISAHNKGVDGDILIKHRRKVTEFIPDKKAEDDEKKWEEKKPDLKEDDTKKVGKDEGADDTKAVTFADRLTKVHRKGAGLRGEEREAFEYKPDNRNVVQRFSDWIRRVQPPRNERVHRWIYDPKISEEERAIRLAIEADTLESVGYRREAERRGHGERFGRITDTLKGVGKAALISAVVAAAVGTGLGIFGLTAGLTVSGLMGGAVGGGVGKWVTNMAERAGKTGWQAKIPGILAGILAGGATTIVAHNWGVDNWLNNLFSGGGVSGPGSVDTSPGTPGKLPDYFDSLDSKMICGNESVWSHLTGSLEDVGFLDHTGRERFAAAFHDTINKWDWQSEFLTYRGHPLEGVDWKALPNGAVANFEDLFSQADFRADMHQMISERYPSLARQITESGLSVKDFIRNVGFAYGVR